MNTPLTSKNSLVVGQNPPIEVVHVDFARKLERDRARLIEALQDLAPGAAASELITYGLEADK